MHGSVHRDNGGAIAEARVFFSASPVEVPDVALLTDAEGRFTIHAPAPGHYEVSCHADGLEPATVAIDVDASQEEVQVDIALRMVAE